MRIVMIAPAKINLWLRVGPRRPDGFHTLDTLFCSLDLADNVVLRQGEPGRGIRLGVRPAPPLAPPLDLGPVEENLAMRAAVAFQRRVGVPEDVRIAVLKRVPPGGGLGGGSSDAAAVLRGLRRMHPDRSTPDALKDMGPSLGSDVSFFLLAHPLALGSGRGDELAPLTPLPQRHVVLVLPTFRVATADAYGWLDEARSARSPLPRQRDRIEDPLSWDQVAEIAHNDFEGPVFQRHEGLRRIRDTLADAGAEIALLAGSGSTVFGTFERHEDALSAAGAVEAVAPDAGTLVTATRVR